MSAPRVRGLFAALAVLLALLGLGVRFTVKDSTVPSAVVFYALRPPVIALYLAAAALLVPGRRLRPMRVGLGAAALVLALTWLDGSYRRGPLAGPPSSIPPPGPAAPSTSSPDAPAQRPATLRVATWNVARGRLGFERVKRRLPALDADVIALVEAGRHPIDLGTTWDVQLEGYQAARMSFGLLVLARGRIVEARLRHLGHKSVAAMVTVEVKGETLRLALVDVYGSPLTSRGPILKRLDRILARAAPPVDVVLGDFNTPTDSLWLEGMRKGYTHAFEAAGTGLDGTWPSPLPLLPIDQVWVGPRLAVLHAEHGFRTVSDHRFVLADLAVRGPAPATAGAMP